jgi:micrococcal nuclease
MKRGMIYVALLALAAAACEPDTTTRVVDGEHVIVKGHKITLHQLDAPESKGAKCDREKQLAALTEERLEGLLLAAKDVEFRKTGMACLQMQDCDGFVKVDGEDVGDILIREGLAVRGVIEEGGGMTRDWCAATPVDEPIQTIAPDEPSAPPPEQQVAPAQN